MKWGETPLALLFSAEECVALRNYRVLRESNRSSVAVQRLAVRRIDFSHKERTGVTEELGNTSASPDPDLCG